MNDLLLFLMSVSSVLAIYWIAAGQWKYNKMMRESHKARAVIFDMDGVLVDSKNAWYKLFNNTLNKYGMKSIDDERFTKDVWGKAIESVIKKYFKGRDVKEISSSYFDRFPGFIKDIRKIEGVDEVLEFLDRKGLKKAVVTNTFRKQAIEVLKSVGLAERFDVILCGDDVREGKPEPEIVLKACSSLGVGPEHAIMVGDTQNDIIAGRKAGCFTVGINTDADKRIKEIKEILYSTS